MSARAESSISTQDERVLAAIAHATIIWPAIGILAPLVVWATQREKSRFVAFQALQAGAYHLTLILAGLACGVCYFCGYLGMLVGAISTPLFMSFTLPQQGPMPEELPPEVLIPLGLSFAGMIVFYVLILGLFFLGLGVWVGYIAYGLYGAVANLRGKDFRYVIIGPRLERYLEGTAAEPGAAA
jgi:hypothetical protein